MPTTQDTVVRELVCVLNETELLERGDQMAGCELKSEQLKVERKRLNAALREQTDRRAELAQVIEAQRETREVPCRWKPDYKTKTWVLHRSDTDERVEERSMSEADLQTKLPGAQEDEDAEAGPEDKPKRKRAARKK